MRSNIEKPNNPITFEISLLCRNSWNVISDREIYEDILLTTTHNPIICSK